MPPGCAFTLKYNSKANLDVLKVLEGGIMAQIKSGQMQVLIGAKSNAIFEEVSKQVHITDGSEEDKPAEKPKNKVSAVIETISCAESWLPSGSIFVADSTRFLAFQLRLPGLDQRHHPSHCKKCIQMVWRANDQTDLCRVL